jgi:prepilin-type N-terminal cleavage/methylation domain-containing protein
MKKGFSLIELLAVIVLLGIVVTITAISVMSVNKNSNERLKNEKIKYIETGALKWGENNLNSLGFSCYYISVNNLIRQGYITGDNTGTNGSTNGELLIPGESGTFNNKCVCVKYENLYSGKEASIQKYTENVNTDYQVTATYGEGACQ